VKRFSLLNAAKYLWTDRDNPYPVTIGFKNYFPGLLPSEQEQIAIDCATV